MKKNVEKEFSLNKRGKKKKKNVGKSFLVKKQKNVFMFYSFHSPLFCLSPSRAQ